MSDKMIEKIVWNFAQFIDNNNTDSFKVRVFRQHYWLKGQKYVVNKILFWK